MSRGGFHFKATLLSFVITVALHFSRRMNCSLLLRIGLKQTNQIDTGPTRALLIKCWFCSRFFLICKVRLRSPEGLFRFLPPNETATSDDNVLANIFVLHYRFTMDVSTVTSRETRTRSWKICNCVSTIKWNYLPLKENLHKTLSYPIRPSSELRASVLLHV